MPLQKISIPPSQRVIKNSEGGGGGLSKAKPLKGNYEAKLEFPGGGGQGNKLKNPAWGEYGYFLEQHIVIFLSLQQVDMRELFPFSFIPQT